MSEICAGCGRDIISIYNFPDDYPIDMMMCCACTSSYYWYLEILKPHKLRYYTNSFCGTWWSRFGWVIEKIMRIL